MIPRPVQVTVALVGLLVAGCTTVPRDAAPQALLASELLRTAVRAKTLQAPDGEIAPDSTTVSRMQREAAERGVDLVAVAFVSTGIHPWYAAAFLRRGGRIEVVGTAVIWGEVTEKCQALVHQSDLTFFLAQARSALACAKGASPSMSEQAWGSGGWLVALDHGRIESMCQAEWSSEQASELCIFLDSVLRADGNWVCRGVPHPHVEVPEQP